MSGIAGRIRPAGLDAVRAGVHLADDGARRDGRPDLDTRLDVLGDIDDEPARRPVGQLVADEGSSRPSGTVGGQHDAVADRVDRAESAVVDSLVDAFGRRARPRPETDSRSRPVTAPVAVWAAATAVKTVAAMSVTTWATTEPARCSTAARAGRATGWLPTESRLRAGALGRGLRRVFGVRPPRRGANEDRPAHG